MRHSRFLVPISAATVSLAMAIPLKAVRWTGQEQPKAAAEMQAAPAAKAEAQCSPQPQCRAVAPSPAATKVVAEPSLGELARKLKAEEAKHPTPPAIVFTNDNLPTGGGNLSVVGPPAGQEGATEIQTSAGAYAKRGPEYARASMAELQEKLNTHQRELAVLQQKLGQNQVQYYPNPSEALQQQYSRADIDKLTAAIDEKKKQVDADQQAISNLQDEVARQGGDVNSLRLVQPADAATAIKPDLTGVKTGTQEFWKRSFKAARAELARSQEQQKLSEDELALLQSQQAHDIGTANAGVIAGQVAAKEADVASKQAATAQAEKNLAALEQEFQASGAPAEWAEPDPSTAAAPPQ
ncbi:MAG TPA: hypothetical protein VL523_11875 [Terriglobia bacterium]|nr:hypothetical protein [Terriglobia bacterium]